MIRLIDMESKINDIEYSDAISIIDKQYRGFDRFIEMKIEKRDIFVVLNLKIDFVVIRNPGLVIDFLKNKILPFT